MKNKRKGFTLVELIVVIVILAILIGVSIGGLYQWVNKSRVNTDINNAASMKKALETLVVDESIGNISKTNKGSSDSKKLIYKQEWSKSESIANEVPDSETIDPTDIIDNKIGDILVDGLPNVKSSGKFVLEVSSSDTGETYLDCRFVDGEEATEEDGTPGSDEGSEESSLVAGLYDADDKLIVKWEESDIDVSIDYTYSNYKTSKTSGYYVVTKKISRYKESSITR